METTPKQKAEKLLEAFTTEEAKQYVEDKIDKYEYDYLRGRYNFWCSVKNYLST